MKLSWKAFTAPQEAAVVTTAQRTEAAMPYAGLLALEVPAGLRLGDCLVDSELCNQRVANLLIRQRDSQADDEQDRHRPKERPTLAGIANHAPKRVREPGGDGEDCDEPDEVGEWVRVLERMGRVRIEEPAAVRAKLLDDLLARDGAQGDGLASAFKRSCVRVGAQGLRHSLPDLDQREDQADGQAARRGSPARGRPRSSRSPRRIVARGRESARWRSRCPWRPRRSCGTRGPAICVR